MTGPSIPALQQRVRAVLERRLGDAIDQLGIDDKIAEALGGRYDSLTALECITAVEEEFGLEVDFVTHDVRHWFSTVGLMAQFVHDELEDRALLGEGR